MPVEELILQTLRGLPASKQQEVLSFVQSLATKEAGAKKPLKSLEGICAGMGVSISAEEIDEARKEMWGNFPREDF